MLLKGGFQVKGWLSNQSLENEIVGQEKPEMKLLRGVTQEKILGTVWNHAKDMLLFNVNPPNDITLTKRTVLSQIARILLGTVWNHAKDMLLFNVNPPNDITLTKRTVLSQIARIFDPVGFAAAFLVRAKIGMQRLWQQGLDWDQELPSAAREEWIRFFQEMGDLNHVTFERSLTPVDAIALPILCIFSDASKEAFGACAYV